MPELLNWLELHIATHVFGDPGWRYGVPPLHVKQFKAEVPHVWQFVLHHGHVLAVRKYPVAHTVASPELGAVHLTTAVVS